MYEFMFKYVARSKVCHSISSRLSVTLDAARRVHGGMAGTQIFLFSIQFNCDTAVHNNESPRDSSAMTHLFEFDGKALRMRFVSIDC